MGARVTAVEGFGSWPATPASHRRPSGSLPFSGEDGAGALPQSRAEGAVGLSGQATRWLLLALCQVPTT